jgi:hypothetical protein
VRQWTNEDQFGQRMEVTSGVFAITLQIVERVACPPEREELHGLRRAVDGMAKEQNVIFLVGNKQHGCSFGFQHSTQLPLSIKRWCASSFSAMGKNPQMLRDGCELDLPTFVLGISPRQGS